MPRAEFALVGQTFTSPVELNDWLSPQVWEHGKKVSANPALRATYALNALVAVDNAVCVLFARENGFASFDEMIPDACRPALSCHHAKSGGILEPMPRYEAMYAKKDGSVQ